ncbi:glycosyl hydrolase family 28-related protein [Mycolicibacterium litorale]|uniref:glycosyl hydrolase family 28-related protein n=1 Tax=Mycolicibacterium litorale TaxID=758802 RepID=UPI003CF0D862
MSAPAVAALLVCAPRASAQTMVNVRDFGAVGDGVADDADAIVAAVATLTPGSILYFPGGQYRFARRHPPGGAAIVVTGLSDVEIRFEPDAELVMDNIDAATSTGTGHGILVRGPASEISLRGVAIRWTRPAKRSIGDGIRIVGYPTGLGSPPTGWEGPSAPVRGVTLTGCRIQGSPQAGVIMMGASDIEVTGLRVRETRGDGLHFNACQQGRVDDYTANDTGDDGLALVTYYSEEFGFDPAAETFSFPSLNEWSDAQFTATNITVEGGGANGVRLAGANGVEIISFAAKNVRSGAGVMIDSASVGSDTEWNYVASRGVRLAGIGIRDCEFGLHVLARPDDARDRRFADFDVRASDVTVRDCANWGVRAESITDLPMTGLHVETCSVAATSTLGGHGGVGLGDTDGVVVGRVSIRHTKPVAAFQTHNSTNTAVHELYVAIAEPTAPSEPPPCVYLDQSSGVFDRVLVNWPAAPASWHPIRVTNQGVGCGPQYSDSPVKIRALGVEPESVTDPVTRC